MTDKRIAIIIDADGKAGIAAFDATTGAVGGLSKAMDDLNAKSKRSGDAADYAGKKWEQAAKWAGMFVSGALVGFTALVGTQIKVADETGKLATKIGVTTEFISELGYAAKMSGADSKILEAGLFGVSEAAVKAEAGVKRPAAAFKAMGIDVTDANGKLKSLEVLLPQIADKFQRMKDGPKEAALATVLFGNSARDLLPLLNEGAAGIEALRERAHELGLTVTDETASSAAELNDKLDLLRARVTGIAANFATELVPVLISAADKIDKVTASSTEAHQQLALFDFSASSAAKDLRFFEESATDVAVTVSNLASGIFNLGGSMRSLLTGDFKGAAAKWRASDQNASTAWNAFFKGVPDFSNVFPGVKWAGEDAAPDSMFRYTAAQAAARRLAGTSDPDTGPVFNPPKDDSKERERALDRQREALKRYREEAALLTAEIEGPMAVAEAKHKLRIDELREAYSKGNITLQDRDALMKAANQQRDETIRKLEEEANVLGRLHDEMEEEVRLAGMSADARRVEEAVLRAIADAHRVAVEQKRADLELTPQQIATTRAYVAAKQEEIKAAERSVQWAEDYRDAWVGAASDASRAFGDWFSRGFKGAKDFASGIKDIFKRLVSDLVTMFVDRSLVQPFQQMLGNMLGLGSGGGQLAPAGAGGQQLGGILQAGFDSLLSGIGKLFGFGGQAQQGMQTAVSTGFKLAQQMGVAVPGSVLQGGGVMLPNGQVAGGSLGGFTGISPWVGALGGAAMGWGMGGDTPGKIGGALAGGTLAYTMMMSGGGLAGLAAGSAAGGLFGGLSGMVGALGPAGWIALGAMAINSLSGGKLFGTKFKTESASQQWSISGAGATGSESITEVRQQSFFRGRKWKTTTNALDAEAMQAINDLFATLEKTVAEAAGQLGVTTPDLIGGSFKREFDSKGNLTKEFGTIAGKVYNEAQEAFAARLVGENLLAVAKVAGGGAEIEQLADRYRSSGDTLQAFATFMLAVQADIKNAQQLWTQTGDGVLTMITDKIAGLAKAGESLAEAYARVSQTARQYGDLIGGVKFKIATHGLNDYQRAQLDVELNYRSLVKQANELAKSLGLAGARAEDLASIEQLRALQMADLQGMYRQQIEDERQAFLDSLSLSDLSPLRDEEKLAEAMQMLRDAAAAGDWETVQQRAQQVLGLGRDMYASGADYNALYAQVRDIINGMTIAVEQQEGLTQSELSRIADLLESQPLAIAQALFDLLQAPTTQPEAPAPAPTPTPPNGGGGGGGGGGGYDTPSCVAFDMYMDTGTRAIDAQAGDLHDTLDPEHGHAVLPVRVVGAAVLQPCVRIVTESGAALVCSRTTPFTDPDAPADLPEWTTMAPDMLGKRVFVQRGDKVTVEAVVEVQDTGAREVIPLDFGGRSFPAGEDFDALIYSHNIMKAGVNSNDIGALLTLMDRAATASERLVAAVESKNLESYANGSRGASSL